MDQAQVDRLFAADRDPKSLCRPDDWMPMGGQENEEAFLALDGYATVGARRRLYRLHLVD